jgi:hypothetical protein
MEQQAHVCAGLFDNTRAPTLRCAEHKLQKHCTPWAQRTVAKKLASPSVQLWPQPGQEP